MAQRTCGIDGCDSKHLARGMCGTHYNKTRYTPEQRHRKHAVPCSICGTTVLRRVESTYAATCSVRCRTVVQWGRRLAPTNSYDWAADAIKRAREHGAVIVDRFDREEIFERDSWACAMCGIRCSSPNPFVLTSATVDHIAPLSLGGPHSRANARTACLSCNSRRQAVAAPPAA